MDADNCPYARMRNYIGSTVTRVPPPAQLPGTTGCGAAGRPADEFDQAEQDCEDDCGQQHYKPVGLVQKIKIRTATAPTVSGIRCT